jgi:hypothetical protein
MAAQAAQYKDRQFLAVIGDEVGNSIFPYGMLSSQAARIQ